MDQPCQYSQLTDSGLAFFHMILTWASQPAWHPHVVAQVFSVCFPFDTHVGQSMLVPYGLTHVGPMRDIYEMAHAKMVLVKPIWAHIMFTIWMEVYLNITHECMCK